MKICIIAPKGLPIPNVKGGAIETLINDIIDQNEIKKELDITVASIYDEEALNVSNKYKNTKFIFVKMNLKYKLKSLIVRIKNLLGYHLNTYNEMILDKIKKEKFDYVVVEDGAYHSFESYLKYYNKEQMILHFHHVGLSDKKTDMVFGKFIAVSDYVKNVFKKSSNIKNCITLKNGINIEKFQKKITQKECNEIKKSLNFASNDFIVVFCGRLVPVKGVLELIQAIKQIDNTNIKLMIIGSINFGIHQTSPYLETLEKEISSSNGRIVLTGYLDNSQIYKYYHTADVGVVPSTYEDAAPLVPIEMMASGLSVIITNSGGAPEFASKETIIVKKEKNLVSSLKKSILDLYKNKEKLKQISTTNKKHSENFTTQKYYDDFVKIVKEK